MNSASLRASGGREEPAGDRPHHQLPQGALGAGRGGRQDLQHLLLPGQRRRRARGAFTVQSGFQVDGVTRETEPWLFYDVLQMQVSGMSTSTVLRDLQPDTKYTVMLVPVYTDVEGKRSSANGRTSKLLDTRPHVPQNSRPPQVVFNELQTHESSEQPPARRSSRKLTVSCGVSLSEPLGGVKNLKVTEPTTSSLKVRWDPAEGNVRQYRIFYVPRAGGAEDMVRVPLSHVRFPPKRRSVSLFVPTGAGFRWNHQHRAEEPSV